MNVGGDAYDWYDTVDPATGYGSNSSALVHEVGHSLGLHHPGSKDSADEYSRDPSSIMGNIGWKLTLEDFRKAFCEKIGKHYADSDPSVRNVVSGDWFAEEPEIR